MRKRLSVFIVVSVTGRARSMATPGDIVLLSPACASFDAFPNFMARGRFFKSIVESFQEKELL